MTSIDPAAAANLIEANFIAGLPPGAVLSPLDAALVKRVARRMAQAGIDAVGADEVTAAGIKARVDLELCTLENIDAAYELEADIKAAALMRQNAYNVIEELALAGLKIALAAALA